MAQEQQGPLMKACQRMCVVAWQVRFFVLRGCSLLYYSDSSCTALKGDIRLDSAAASVTKVHFAMTVAMKVPLLPHAMISGWRVGSFS
jgi:hypothetical protein